MEGVYSASCASFMESSDIPLIIASLSKRGSERARRKSGSGNAPEKAITATGQPRPALDRAQADVNEKNQPEPLRRTPPIFHSQSKWIGLRRRKKSLSDNAKSSRPTSRRPGYGPAAKNGAGESFRSRTTTRRGRRMAYPQDCQRAGLRSAGINRKDGDKVLSPAAVALAQVKQVVVPNGSFGAWLPT